MGSIIKLLKKIPRTPYIWALYLFLLVVSYDLYTYVFQPIYLIIFFAAVLILFIAQLILNIFNLLKNKQILSPRKITYDFILVVLLALMMSNSFGVYRIPVLSWWNALPIYGSPQFINPEPIISTTNLPSPTQTLLCTSSLDNSDKTNWLKFQSPPYVASYGSEEVQFSILYPPDWSQGFDNIGFGQAIRKSGHGFTFSKGEYEIKIALGYAPGGNACFLSDGTPYFDTANQSCFEIKSGFSTLRRVKSFVNTGPRYVKPGFTQFTLCSYSVVSFAENSRLGKIQYNVPENYDPQMLKEMDSIVSTIQKLK